MQKEKSAFYINITSTFSGIGYVIIDVNSVVLDALDKYRLSSKTVPTQTVFLHFQYILQNLRKYQLKDIILHYENSGDPYFDLMLSMIVRQEEYIIDDKANFKIAFSYEKIKHSIATKRIALALTCTKREELNNFFLNTGIYVGLLDFLTFEIPFAFTLIYKPLDKIDENAEYVIPLIAYKPDTLPEADISQIEESLEEAKMDFYNFNLYLRDIQNQVDEQIVISLLNWNLFKREIVFDGRIFYARSNKIKLDCINTVYEEDLQRVCEMKKKLFGIAIQDKWSGKDLELLMPADIEKVSMKHLANIRKSAMSLFDGKFHYSSIIKETSQPKDKSSAKMLKIIKENEELMKKEKRKTDDIWLRNFFATYSKIGSLKGKRTLLENIKVSSEYAKRKLLLLKVELYSDVWNLEKRGENINEKILIPLYLSILEYIELFTNARFNEEKISGETVESDAAKENDKHKGNKNSEKKKGKGKKVEEDDKNNDVAGSNKEASLEELEFVLTKMIEAGFEATTREILKKLNIEMELPFATNATDAPNDIDLYFQLKYAGDHLKRTLGTRKDKRVPFDPDKWQVQLLDAVDSNKSAVISAPTSSGKTFICFYAIEKILKNSDTDIVVFCLPTKALVNQVSADVYARFNPKSIRTSLQGTLMPDKSSEPFNCQVLITIPALLESLLNSTEVSNSERSIDLSRIKYIIMDEIHKINDSSLGLKIERIIHLARCPLLLLSATLGNLDNFYGWVRNIESSKGRECELVVHTERYCELKTYVYSTIQKTEDDQPDNNPNSSTTNTKFRGKLVPLNNMFAYSFNHLKNFGFGNDLHFLPDELLNIYYYIYMVLDSSQKKLIKSLAPKKFFKSNIICNSDVRGYQDHLLKTFETWVQKSILSEDQVKQVHHLLTHESVDAFSSDLSEKYIFDNILNLLNVLKDTSMLPVIVFNTDREFITRLAKAVYQELENSDIKKKKDKALEKIKKENKRNRDAEKTKDSWIEDSIALEQNIEPEQRDINYTFLDPITKLTDYDIREEFSDIRGVSKEILDMAYRGIGIHHSAMNRKYRSAVEILFRKKHIRVLFATETLALGINMPCRTTVFAGDSLYLDPMNYKQMSGRAGRRGYDTLGNVVFFGIPKMRVQNLMVSSLPEIQGAYTYSNTSLVSFNIEESLIKYPLLSANKADSQPSNDNISSSADVQSELNIDSGLTANIKSLSIQPEDKLNISCVLDIFDTLESREKLVESQKSNYPFIYPSNYLWDLFISNREFDPSIFVFALLIESNTISWNPTEFMNTVAHLFQVIPVYPSFEYSLPALPSMTENILDMINQAYLYDTMELSSLPLKNLQRYTKKPLHLIKSFLYTCQEPKNSYILDFFKHGSSVKIFRNNLVSGGELWQSLYNIDCFLKSLIYLLENKGADDRLKKLRLIYEEFNSKFLKIFA